MTFVVNASAQGTHDPPKGEANVQWTDVLHTPPVIVTNVNSQELVHRSLGNGMGLLGLYLLPRWLGGRHHGKPINVKRDNNEYRYW